MKSPKRELTVATLHESEKLLRAVAANGPMILFALDRTGQFTLSEGKGLRALGLKPGEIVGCSVFDVYRNEPEITGLVHRVLGGEEVSTALEVGDRALRAWCSPVRDEDGGVVGLIGVATDIGEEKRAEGERAVLARQAGLRADTSTALAAGGALQSTLQRCAEAIVQHLGAAFARIWTLNEEKNVLELRASAGMYTHLDGPHGSVPVGRFKIGLIAQERRPHLTNEVFNDPRIDDREWAKREGLVSFAGHPLVVEDRLVGVMAMFAREPLREDAVESLASVADAIAQGIQRNQAEEALTRSERALDAAQRIAHVGNWEYDVGRGAVRWSDEMYRIFGFVPRSFTPSYKTFLRSVHPDDREFLRKAIREALYDRKRADLEYRIVRPEDEVRVVQIRYEIGYDENAGAITLAGTVQDITDRKRTEERLRASEAELKAFFAAMNDLVLVFDREGRCLKVVSANPRLLYRPPEEQLGRTLHEVFPVEQADTFVSWIRQALETRRTVRTEYSLTIEGTQRWLSANVSPMEESVVWVVRDITEGKRAEKALKESEERHRLQARELALLHEVRTALALELDLPSLLREVVEAIARTYGYTLVSAYLLRDGGLVLQHQVGYRHVIKRIALTEGVSGEVVRTGRAALLEDVRDDPKFLGAIQGIVSEICVPLFDGDRVVGTLNVESTDDAKLTQADLRLMEAVCEHVSIALVRAGLYDRVRESEEKFRALIQNSSDLITLYDADGTIRYVSPALKRILDYEPEERIGATSFGLIHPDDVSRAKEGFAEVLRRPGVPVSVEARAQHRDGSWRYIEAVGTNLLAHPSVGAVVLNGRDITERKEAEARLRETEERYRTLVERMPAITYIQEPSEPSRTTYISPQCEEVLGYSQEECMNDPELWVRTLHPADRERVLEQDRCTNATGDPFGMEYRRFAKDGSVVWIRDEAAPVRDEDGRPRYWIGVQVDITGRKVLEERLEHRAFHDPLTGLPNRALFMDRLRNALWRARRKHGQTAVLFLDIDNLKVVNDSLGHEAGDRLLTGAADRLKACLRPADTVARFSGDEFAVLLEDVEDVSEAAQVAERIAEVLRAPLVLKGRETFITASVGIALSGSAPGSTRGSAPDTAQDQAEALLRQADLAMYRAKDRGKAHHEVFDSSMNAPTLVRLETGNDLRRALEREEFRVCYQPKMRLHADLQRSLRFSNNSAIVAPKAAREPDLVGMEALVRWEHPERGLLTPKEFVPVAEESGLIVPIGRMVLEKACRQAQAWQECYATEQPLVMCVNISARQFQHPELVLDVARVLQQTGLEPRCLQLEITESVVMEDVESTLVTLGGLRALGVQLAIDDFGTGYSSLSYLKRFSVDVLKIDRSFVEPLGGDAEDAVIVSGIISLARALNMQVVAEGVETAEQLAYLEGMGCDMVQGNYFSEPLPSEGASALLARHLRARPRADG